MPVSKAADPLTDAQRSERMFDLALPPKLYPRADGHPVMINPAYELLFPAV